MSSQWSSCILLDWKRLLDLWRDGMLGSFFVFPLLASWLLGFLASWLFGSLASWLLASQLLGLSASWLWPLASSAFPVPLRQVAFWLLRLFAGLCGFWRSAFPVLSGLFGFCTLSFWMWLPASSSITSSV